MIRIDAIWLATEPLDMRAGPDTALARVVKVFGAAQPHCASLFANRRGNRMKVLIHDGLGVWLCARRLNQGKFHWAGNWHGDRVELCPEQVTALVQGLPWQRLGADGLIPLPSVAWHTRRMKTPPNLSQLTPDQLRHLAVTLMSQVEEKDKALRHSEQVNQKLTYELALLKRHAFGKRSEQLNVLQISLLEDVVDTDIVAIETELEDLTLASPTPTPKKAPKRSPLPPELPRIEIHHDPGSEHCACGCKLRRIGEEISEKLDYTPGVFHVERHIRGKWVCKQCETLTQAPMPAQIIDKGIPTAGLLAQVLIAKYADHLPLYRQEQIFARAGVAIPRSTLAEWVGICGVRLQPLINALHELLLSEPVLHADETPVPMLAPGKKKTHRAYLWAYATTPYAGLKAVIYDFSEGRSGQHARDFLGEWRGKLVCDDYSGYKQSFANGVTEIGCMAHARRKFVDLHVAGKSQIAEQAIDLIGQLYQIEREAQTLTAEERQRLRDTRARPIARRCRTARRRRKPWMTA